MSTTFWMQQAPVIRVQPYPEDEPDYWTVEPAAPFAEINIAQGNVIDVMLQLDPENVHRDDDGGFDVYGEWNMEKLDIIQRRAMRLLNTNKKESLYVDAFIDQAPGKMTVYHGGRSEDYMTRLLTRFLALIAIAREHGFPITFG